MCVCDSRLYTNVTRLLSYKRPIAAPKEKPKFINRTKGLATQSVYVRTRVLAMNYVTANCLRPFLAAVVEINTLSCILH